MPLLSTCLHFSIALDVCPTEVDLFKNMGSDWASANKLIERISRQVKNSLDNFSITIGLRPVRTHLTTPRIFKGDPKI